jgi:uncharacterized membrane protein YccC
MRIWAWLGRHDPGYGAFRRAGRTAVVMPVLFAIGTLVLRNGDAATFAAFGSFSMLLFVDFNGTLLERVQSQIGLAVAGAVLVCLGTLSSHPVWLAAVAMTLVAFAILFVGSVSSVLASSSTALLLAFILPVTLPGSVEAIPARLAGWGLAAVVSILAITVLWPAPTRDSLRTGVVRASRALASRLRADVAVMLSDRDPAMVEDYERAVAEANDAILALHAGFLATIYRPTNLSTSARTIVRLVDELNWLQTVVSQSVAVEASPSAASRRAYRAACRVKTAAASVLDNGAELLDHPGAESISLEHALDRLTESRVAVENGASTDQPIHRGDAADELVTALDPLFRAQELSYAVAQVAGNIGLTAAAERRTWSERLLGRQPGNLVSTLQAALQRAGAQAERHSVWLHNSIRGAAALGIAVLLADLTGVEHSFWVVLGTLSVLRSNALNTGQNALRGVLGTVVGVLIGAGLLFVIGTNATVLWILLPVAILIAGTAPTAISFAAGQAGFTVTLVLLFNIIAPTGWSVGLYRIEDIALGCGVSLVVGLLFWPRGASAALRQALAEAYADSADYLEATVAFGLGRCDGNAMAQPQPTAQGLRAAAASRRLDDTFRTYLAERGSKRLPLARVTASVTGVAGVRLTGDAILDLWKDHNIPADGDRSAAREELGSSSRLLANWYRDLARQLVNQHPLPDPLPGDLVADGHLIAAVRRDLSDKAGKATATAVRMIWTGEYLDSVRRLQPEIVGPVSLLGKEVSSRQRAARKAGPSRRERAGGT